MLKSTKKKINDSAILIVLGLALVLIGYGYGYKRGYHRCLMDTMEYIKEFSGVHKNEF